MTQKELIKQLRGLQTIQPDREFGRVSRSVILSSQTGIPVERSTRRNIFSRGLSFAASVALAAVFMLVLTLGNIAGPLKTLFLPTLHGVDNKAVVSEADTVKQDIDIRLSDIEYFDGEGAVALASVSPENFAKGENEIDQLLDEVIDY